MDKMDYTVSPNYRQAAEDGDMGAYKVGKR